MDRIDKFLNRLELRRREKIKVVVRRIVDGQLLGLNIKKLKGYQNLFRVRMGDLRIIYELGDDGQATVLDINYRNDTTYNF